MDDFSDLAARIGTSVGELRGVLILSRDGLVLGAFPEDDDSMKPAPPRTRILLSGLPSAGRASR